MQVYLTINIINKKWYIGKDKHDCHWYLGSGSTLKKAIKKYGKNNFKKFILEHCQTKQELNAAEISWIKYTNAVADSQSYNIARGGASGPGDSFKGANNWWKSLSKEQKKEIHRKQGETRSKGWYVSKIDDNNEIFVKNINAWCKEHKIDTSMPSSLNNPQSRLFQKQTKGWRIRRSDMPVLLPYIDKRKIGHENIACKGKSWKLVSGKRVWNIQGVNNGTGAS